MKSWLEYFNILGFNYLYFLEKTKKDNKIEKLEALEKIVKNCKLCPLHLKRKQAVFADGNPNSPLMFIGEAPGGDEDLKGIPFVGKAGQLLNKMIAKMNLKREDVYITNIVKCRPPLNRDPELDEIQKCRAIVENQIEIIKPRVIIALGRISAATLIGNPKISIKAIRGKFFNYRGIPVMPTFHPAYLKRNPKDKWLTWTDALNVLEKLKGNELQK